MFALIRTILFYNNDALKLGTLLKRDVYKILKNIHHILIYGKFIM